MAMLSSEALPKCISTGAIEIQKKEIIKEVIEFVDFDIMAYQNILG